MARRRRATNEASTDLLLDTVCNAFGAIIFIVLLLVLIPVTGTGGSDSEPSAVAADEIQMSMLARLQAELSHQERVADLQERTLAMLQVPDGSENLLLRNEMVAEIAAARRHLEVIGQDDTALDDRLRLLDNRADQLEQIARRLHLGLLQAEEERRKQDVLVTRLPRLRPVYKANYFLVLHQGRVYLTLRPAASSLELYENGEDMTITSIGAGRRYVPRPGRGTPVDQWIASPTGAARLRAVLPRDLFVINICVYPDSVEHFGAVRNAFIGQQYDYNWHPLSQESPLILVRASTSAEAQ